MDKDFNRFLTELGYKDDSLQDNNEINERLKYIKAKENSYGNIGTSLFFLFIFGEIIRVFLWQNSIFNIAVLCGGLFFFIARYKEYSYKNKYKKYLTESANNYEIYEGLYQSEALLQGFIKELQADPKLPDYYRSASYYSGLINNLENRERFIPEIQRFIKQYKQDINSDKNKTETLCNDFLKRKLLLNLIDGRK